MPDIFVSHKKKVETKPLPNNKTSFLSQALSAFIFMPQNVKFETQEPGETIILLLRKHWITNVTWVLSSIILILIPVFLFPWVTLSNIMPNGLPGNILSFSALAWYLLTFSYILVNFLLWYFTVSVVTQERIVDVDFINLLNKKISETRIDRLEDVTMQTGGFIRSFFDYGDVFVQTAAKEAEFEFIAVPHPGEVVRIINQLMGRSEHE